MTPEAIELLKERHKDALRLLELLRSECANQAAREKLAGCDNGHDIWNGWRAVIASFVNRDITLANLSQDQITLLLKITNPDKDEVITEPLPPPPDE